MGTNCKVTGCTRTATWFPILAVTPDQVHYAKAEMRELGVCDECKAETTLDGLVDDKGWKQIAGAFLSVGKSEPRREWTKLEWGKLDG